MKKVGIATMYGASNYGNILQNFAVQEVIESYGYEAVSLRNETVKGFENILNPEAGRCKLRPSYIRAFLRDRRGSRYSCKNDRDFSRLRWAKQHYDEIQAAKARRTQRFAQLKAQWIHSSDFSIDELHWPMKELEAFAAFVCGSDQIWNPFYRTTSAVDFLQFAPAHKRIAFAPSFGVSEMPPLREEVYRRFLNSIPHLSVREQSGAEMIKKLTGRQAEVLLDPSFQLSAEKWRSVSAKPEAFPQKPYIFCYFLGNRSKKYSAWIDRCAAQNKLEIVDVYDICDLPHFDTDPAEFLYYLDHAALVCTDSFHGAALSINLHTPFVVFQRDEGGRSMQSRLQNLMRVFALEERSYQRLTAQSAMQLSFDHADKVLQREREKTDSYLRKALAAAGAGEHRVPLLADEDACTGCGACASTCKQSCIRMQPDKDGFLKPVIAATACIGCGACTRACPVLYPAQRAAVPVRGEYCFAKETTVRGSSSSGGVFTLLAEEIIKRGGAVFGAGFDESYRVCHRLARAVQEVALLRTSKYVQSDVGKTYSEARELLQQGVPVLFTGTPCQIEGLKNYLGRDYENLYTQDIICHGVPSPKAWAQYLKELHGVKEITGISFRDKTYGWNSFAMRITAESAPDYCVDARKDPYERLFLANVCLRQSCYQCRFKSEKHASDITIADYWGVEAVHPELAGEQGVSFVLVQSKKGAELFAAIQDRCTAAETEKDKAIRMNHAALHSVPWSRKRAGFFAELGKTDFKKLSDRCMKKTAKQKLTAFVYRNGARVKGLLRKLRGERK